MILVLKPFIQLVCAVPQLALEPARIRKQLLHFLEFFFPGIVS
ncbi:Uncharacterised protein [Mycobacteroides abscessus subsp. abscessus]|nr:Uncharacterised protein [Mycobacteroides abscessus subsp. abscessus]